MSISGSDLFFVASERMTDNPSPGSTVGGGGDMGSTVLQSGVENNVFPDVMPGDRVSGLVQARKVYATVLSNDNDALANAQVGLLVRPSDANVEMCLFESEQDSGSDDVQVAAYVAAIVRAPLESAGSQQANCTTTAGSNVVTAVADTSAYQVGDRVTVVGSGSASDVAKWRAVTAKTASSVTVDGPAIGWTTSIAVLTLHLLRSGNRPLCALALTTASASAGATSLTLDRLDVRVMTAASAAFYPYDVVGITGGRQPLFFKDDVVLVQHPSTPTTREFATILRVNHSTGVVTFTAGLTNAYPSGSKVTRPVSLRTLQANVSLPPFTQQAWTRAWSDAIIGASISARYSGAVGLVNKGATNDRWAIVFTSSTQFNVISERLGQIGSGNIATNFLPLNPMTNEPFFTLYASGWGGGWIVGNVLRFNTRAAAAPVWLHRCVAPGSASGTDQAQAFIRGDVNA